ncbi:hypothetical protein C8R43DRAFT_167619 [Mycena crocata]|nr:hypothetical protein C8R43DRAFT_167619 [Mycena crocata]
MFQTLRLQQEHTQMLAAENAELKAQLTQTGAGHKITTSTVTSRGRLASRGKVTVRSGRNPAVIHRERSTSVLADDGGNSSEPESDHHPADEDPTAAVVYLDRKNCDTVEVKKARTALQVFVSKTFREVCGVSTKDRWPDFDEFRVDEVTRLRLPNPKFAADVKDLANVRLFLTVAKQAQADLRRRGNRPKDLLAVKARWDLELLQEMAKTSFQNFKPAWKKQFDLAAQARDEAKKRTNRWRQRRITKVEQNAKGIPKFAAEYNMDPATLLEINYEDHQSDEASGPDSDDDRYDSKMAWKVEMARLAGYSNLTAQELEKLNMLEVINPDWRSDTLSTVFHDLHGRWRNSRTAKEKESVIYTRVRTSGRRSRRIPAVSPWDFGISSQWLEAARADETNDDRLREWGTFGNPVGWDSTLFDAATTTATTPIIPSAGSRASEDDPPAPNAQAVDPRFDFDSLYD